MGADYVFDYRDPDVVDKIKSQVPNIGHVFDCIGTGTSSTQASQAVRAEGGLLCTVRPGKANTENVERRVQVTDVLVWTAFLKDHQYREFKWPVCNSSYVFRFRSSHFFCRPHKLITICRASCSKISPGGLKVKNSSRTWFGWYLEDLMVSKRDFRCIEMGRSLHLRSCMNSRRYNRQYTVHYDTGSTSHLIFYTRAVSYLRRHETCSRDTLELLIKYDVNSVLGTS